MRITTGHPLNAALAEEFYTRQAATYAKMLSLTREDVINHDLSAFDDLWRRVGGGPAQKLSDVFWTAVMDNSTFFTSGRGNYIDEPWLVWGSRSAMAVLSRFTKYDCPIFVESSRVLGRGNDTF